MMARSAKTILTIVFSALVLPCAVSWAGFRLDVAAPVLPVEKWFWMDFVIEPEEGGGFFGGQVLVEVDPDAVRLSEKRERYGASEMFSEVEKFDIDVASGTVVFRAMSSDEVTGPKVFLRVRAMLKKTGATTIRFSSSTIAKDGRRKPSADGWYRLFGIEGGEVDPLLYSALMTENNRLSAGVGVRDTKEAAMEGGEMLGFTEMVEVKEREAADAIIGFSNTSLRVGEEQYVRLDVEVKKLPNIKDMNGLSAIIVYDKGALKPVDSEGLGARDLVDLIPPFTFALANRIDRGSGEILIEVSTPMEAPKAEGEGEEAQELKDFPVKVATLYFKAMAQTPEAVVKYKKVMMDVSSDATVLMEEARVKVEGKRLSCAPGLPATLCTGNIDITGAIAMRVTNSKELRGASQQAGAAANINTAQAGASQINRMYLDQTWNLQMGGGFKNGWSLKGDISDSPFSPQSLKMSLTSTDWELLFGDYGANITGGNMVGLNVGSASGFQWNFKRGPWGLKTALVESRSSPGQTPGIKGTGITGPYQLPGVRGKAIVDGSIRVEKNGRPMKSADYYVDTVRGEITFTKQPLFEDDEVVVFYEQSSFVFSTGNLLGARLDYNPDNKRLKAGATYIQATSALEGTTLTLSRAETKILTELDEIKCIREDNTCMVVQLENRYVVPGSIVITATNNIDLVLTEVRNPEVIFIGHRSHFLGKFFVDKSNMQTHYSNFRVSYDYYNPAYIDTNGFNLYRNVSVNTIGEYWPTQIFPGSEIVYASNDTDSQLHVDDQILCYQDKSSIFLGHLEDEDEVEGNRLYDDPDYCPIPKNLFNWYKLVQSGINYYLDFSEEPPPVLGAKPNIKMTYQTIPTFLPSSSEFGKIALGVDAKYKLGRKWKFSTDWGRTNSDLSSTFHQTEELLAVDVQTNVAEDEKTLCHYLEDTQTLNCKLAHDKIFGDVTVQIKKCERAIPAKDNVCIEGKYASEEPLLNSAGVDTFSVANGQIVIYGQDTSDTGYSNFPDKGDILIINYVYEPVLSRLVEADGYNFTADFDTRNLNFSFHRHEHDPNYDKRMGGGGNYTSLIEAKTDFRIKKLGVGLSYIDPQTDVNDTSGVPQSSLSSPSRSLTLNYSSGRLTQLTYGLTTRRDYGITSTLTNQLKDTSSRTGSFGAGYDLNKARTMKLSYNRQTSDTSDRLSSTLPTRQRTDTYNWSYARSRKTNVSAAFTKGKTQPTGNRSSGRNYDFKFKPTSLFDVNLKFGKTESSSVTTTGVISNENEQINYDLNFVPFWKVNGLAYRFSRTDQAPTSNQVVGTRNDSTNIGFTFDMGKGFNIKPNVSRTASSAPGSRTNTKNTGWNSTYTGFIGKRTYTIKIDQGRANSVTSNLTTNTSVKNSNSSRGMSISFNPSDKYTTQFSYNNSKQTAATTRTYNYNVTYKPYPRMSFNSGYNISRAYSASSSRTNAFNLGMNYKVNDQTSLELRYSANTAAGARRAAVQRLTKFQAELKTDFKGKR